MTTKKNFSPMQWDSEKIKRFWDYESQFPGHYFTYQFGTAIVNGLFPYLKNRRDILDFGSGPGHITDALLSATNGFVTSADFSPGSVLLAKNKFKTRDRYKGAYLLDELNESGDRYDAIVCVELIEHLSDDQLVDFVRLMRKFLKNDGVLLITTPNNEDLDAQTVFCPECRHTFHRWQHVRKWSNTSLRTYFNNAGFDCVEIKATDFSISGINKIVRNTSNILRKILGKPTVNPHLIYAGKLLRR